MGLPGVDMRNFGTGFIRRRASRAVSDLINGLGPAGVEKILDSGKPLSEILPTEKLAGYRRLAHENAWMADAITDEQLLAMIPTWALEIVRNKGPAGQKWLQEQIAWIRSLFT